MSTLRKPRRPFRSRRTLIGATVAAALVVVSMVTFGAASGQPVAQHKSGETSAASGARSSTHLVSRGQGHASYVVRPSRSSRSSSRAALRAVMRSGSSPVGSSALFPNLASNRLLTATGCGGTIANASGFEDNDANLNVDHGGTGCTDWNGFSPVTWGGPAAPYQQATKSAPPFNFLGIQDAIGSNDTTYKDGTKQNDTCPTVLQNGSTPNKDDLARLYFAGERINNHPYLFLAWVRAPQNTVNSDLHVAFEFNQSTTPCANSSLVLRTTGDLLVGYDFQSSGVTITLSIWDSSLNSGKGGWGPATDITSSGAAEGAANTGGGVTDAIKPPNAANPGTDEFGEAGIDIGALIPPGNGRPCETFGTVSGATRTSGESTSANMEDLVGPAPIDISNCASPSISTLLSNQGPIAIGGSVNDSSTLTGATADAGGTVKYAFYSSLSDCNAGTFATPGGTSLGTKTVTAGVVPNSDSTGAINAAGTYYFRAFYSGDGNNNAASSACADEALVVNPNAPSISTLLSKSTGSVGDSVHDSATINGATADAGGTINYAVYSDNECSNLVADLTPADNTVVDGVAPDSLSHTFNSAGTFYFQATYSGDNNNTGPVSSPCESEQLVINAAAIHIVKTADAAKVNVGSPIGFTLTVYNTGIGDANGVQLNDTLPTNAGLSWSIASQGAGWGGSCAIAAGKLTCGPVTVPAGTTQAASTFTVHITSPTTGATGGDCPNTGVVDNTGSVTASNDGSDQSSASTCVQALVDLTVTKAGSPATQTLGDGNITWTIVVTNNGPSAATGVTIADPMPAGNTFVSASTTQGSCTGGAILNCNIGTMAAGASATITLVTTPSTVGAQTNTVTVAGNRPETNTGNNSATASVQTVGVITPPVFCVAVSKVTPTQLFVGRKTKLTIHVTQNKKAVQGIHVQIKGPKINLRTGASNSKGVITQQLKMKKAGILIFSPIASKKCNTKRVGVTNVFTPPVTG